MVPTDVLVTVVLASFALLGGAFYALVQVQGTRISDLGVQLGNRLDDFVVRSGGQLADLGGRIDDLGANLGGRIDDLGAHLGGRIDDLGGQVGGRLADLSSRMSALETRQHADMLDLREDLSGIRAALAVLDARVSTLER